MSDREDNDSDAPEEFTAEQGLHQDQLIRKLLKESKARIVREGKERRRSWADKKTPRSSKKGGAVQNVAETPGHKDLNNLVQLIADRDKFNERKEPIMSNLGMLPSDLVQRLAESEKRVVFSTDSGDEKPAVKRKTKRKKAKSSGVETVILNERKVNQCSRNSLEFLKKRKMNIGRSSSVLDNHNQALRLLSTSGLLIKK